MPYIPVPTLPSDVLLATAERRWANILVVHPDLRPALDLQRTLLAMVIDLSQAISGRLPRLSLPPRYIAAKLARGVPAFSGEPIPLPVPLLRSTLVRLCAELAAGGAGDPATHIQEALENGSMEAGSLLTASFSRNQSAIRTGAEHRGLSSDLLWLVAELAVSPVAHALQHALFAPGGQVDLAAALAGWSHGYCPACGSWPALAEVVGGHRTMRCSFCASAWELTTYACAYCEADGEAFVTAAPNADRPDMRVELCSACGSYLKTVDLFELSAFPLLAIGDLETAALDVAAMEHGFVRHPLKEFAAR